MSASFYRSILKKSASIALQNKYLWFFGFFSALIARSGIESIIFGGADGADNTFLYARVFAGGNLFGGLKNLFSQDLLLSWFALLFFCLWVLFMLFILWMAVSSTGALIAGSAKINRRQKTDSATAWAMGRSNFWPLCGTYLIIKFFSCLILAELFMVFFLPATSFANNFVIFIALFIALPFLLIIHLVAKYAFCYIVLQGKKMREAISDGWKLFKRNWLVSLEMALILFGVNIVFFALILLLVVSFLMPLFIAVLIAPFAGAFGSAAFLFYFSFIFLILAVIIAIVLAGSIFSAFQYAAWTLLFEELATPTSIMSKIFRIAEKYLPTLKKIKFKI